MKNLEKNLNRIYNFYLYLYSFYQLLTSIFTRYFHNLTISRFFHLFISYKSFSNRFLNSSKNKLL